MAENFFGLTDTGKIRDNNEDTFIAHPITGNYLLACVIDGVGGYHGGDIAAAIAREEITQKLSKIQGDIIPLMIDAFKQASDKIYQKKQEDKDHNKMACVATLVIADVNNNQFYYAHVGDTRLYLLRDGSLVKISKDHSFVGFLEDSGRLTETAAMKHPKRNEINKALGFSNQIDDDDSYIETGQSPFLPGDMLLLCSDGLTDMVEKEEITELITQNNTLEQKATALINAANNNGGSDNITVVLVHNNKERQTPTVTIPAGSQKKSNVIDKDVLSAPERTVTAEPPPVVPAKKSNGFTALLGIFCLAFLGSSIWLYLQWQKAIPAETQTVITKKPPRKEQEQLLQDAFDNATGDTLILSDTVFKSPVLITDTLHIHNDSLFVKVKGNLIIQRDTAYYGPALAISPHAKITVLDSLQFNDFPVAIYLNNTALFLKNVRFVNCAVPVNNAYQFGGKGNVTARLPVLNTSIESSAINRSIGNGAR